MSWDLPPGCSPDFLYDAPRDPEEPYERWCIACDRLFDAYDPDQELCPGCRAEKEEDMSEPEEQAQAETPRARITRTTLTKQLRVAYTPEDREEIIQEMLDHLRMEEELKQDRRDLNRKIKGHIEARNNASEQLDAGGEEQDVACELVWNFEPQPETVEALGITVEANSVALVRLDTKGVVESRPIKPEERQASFLAKETAPPAEELPVMLCSCDRQDLRENECGWCGDDDCPNCCRTCDGQELPCPERPEGCNPQLVVAGDGQEPQATAPEAA